MLRSIYICSISILIFALWDLLLGIVVVEWSPLRWRFMWTLLVAGDDFGRCFYRAAAVSPSHVVNCLFSISSTNVLFVGLNRHWCRYVMRDSLLVMVYVFAAMWCFVESCSIVLLSMCHFGCIPAQVGWLGGPKVLWLVPCCRPTKSFR